MSVKVLGVKIDQVTMDGAVSQVAEMIAQRGPHLVITANSEMVMLANHDPLLYQIIDRADLVVADGIGVVWASRMLGKPLRQRIPGVELMEAVLARSVESKWKVFLLGGEPGVTDEAGAKLLQLYPGLQIVGSHHGFFRKEEEEQVFASIKAVRPDILFIALGVPKQEKWAAAYLAHLDVPVAMGVGGSLNIFAGRASRGPKWMQRYGLEWLYRLLKQPWRAGRMLALPQFALWVVLERLMLRGDFPYE